MSDWVLDDSQNADTSSQPISNPGDWVLDAEPEASSSSQESYGTSLLKAPGRIGADVAHGISSGLQNLYHNAPRYYEAAKTEIPAALGTLARSVVPGMNFLYRGQPDHRLHSAMQGVAGGLEAINSLNKITQLPLAVSQYGANRLNLVPQSVPDFFQKTIPAAPDSTQAINQLFGQPQYPGEAFIRGSVRNIPNTYGAASLLSALNPLRFATRTKLTPAQLKEALAASVGTKTDLGSIIGSGPLKFAYQNVLSKTPLSGAAQNIAQTAEGISGRGQQIMNSLLGDHPPGDTTTPLKDALSQAYKTNRMEKEAFYDDVNKYANSTNLKMNLTNFANEAKKYSSLIKDTNILKYEPDVASIYNKLLNYKKPNVTETKVGSIVDKYGQPFINETTITYPSLEEANLLKARLNKYANEFGSSSDSSHRHAAGIFRNLARTLKGDIKSSIDAHGDPELSRLYHGAEDNYAKNFSPFLDKDIYKHATGNADSDTIVSSFLKPGGADRGNLLNKLMEKLPEDKKGLVPYTYFSKAIDDYGQVNPLTFEKLYSGLGQKQKNALFPDELQRAQVAQYANLIKMNKKVLSDAAKEPSGNALNTAVSLVSAPAGVVGRILGSRPMVNYLTSQKVRERIINKMIKSASKKG